MEQFQNHTTEAKILYAIGFVELEIAAIDLPQKLFLGKIILALFF